MANRPAPPDLVNMLAELRLFTEALQLHECAWAITEASFGPNHLKTALRLDNLADTRVDLDRYDEAFPLRERALAITEARLGAEHPTTVTRFLHNFVGVLRRLDRYPWPGTRTSGPPTAGRPA